VTDSGRLRASDADREKVVAVLREQTGQGRLTLQEFEERAATAYTAKTYDELEPLTADLPVPHPVLPLPATVPEAPTEPWHRRASRELSGMPVWLIVALIFVAISVAGYVLPGNHGHYIGFSPWLLFMFIWWGRRGRYYRR
jgi:hypothetical protein